MKDSKLFKFLANTFLLLLVLLLSYNLGFNVIQNYYTYGFKITIFSFVVGVPLTIVFIIIFQLIDKKINK